MENIYINRAISSFAHLHSQFHQLRHGSNSSRRVSDVEFTQTKLRLDLTTTALVQSAQRRIVRSFAQLLVDSFCEFQRIRSFLPIARLEGAHSTHPSAVSLRLELCWSITLQNFRETSIFTEKTHSLTVVNDLLEIRRVQHRFAKRIDH